MKPGDKVVVLIDLPYYGVYKGTRGVITSIDPVFCSKPNCVKVETGDTLCFSRDELELDGVFESPHYFVD